MKKMLVVLGFVSLVLSGYANACQCKSDYGVVTSNQKVIIAEMLETQNVSVDKMSGHLTALAYADKNTYFSQCGCSKYFYTLADVTYSDGVNSCVATVKIKNWNDKVIIRNTNCR